MSQKLGNRFRESSFNDLLSMGVSRRILLSAEILVHDASASLDIILKDARMQAAITDHLKKMPVAWLFSRLGR